MSQNVVLQAAGLQTFTNYLGSVPNGALLEALNVVIDRNNIVEPRRGFSQYGNTFGISTNRTKQVFNYKNRILRHVNTSIQYDSDVEGTFSSFSGNVQEIETGLRIKAIEANGNFYFVTSEGIKKISASTAADFPTAAIEMAGGIKALDVIGNVNYSNSGFLTPQSYVAYRVVWGKRDVNDNLILGAPSNRAVIQNISPTQSCVVDLEFPIPSEITTTDYFYQIYRTGVFSGDPGEEMNLVFEDFVSSAQLVAGEVEVTDITPEDFRKGGTLLYINPQSGEGIAQANERPPFAKDITSYKGYTFYGNTSTVHRLTLSLISIQDLISETSEITITNGVTSQAYRFRGTTETYSADFSSGALTKADFVAGALNPGKRFELTAANDAREYYVWYKNSTETDPAVSGKLGIMVDIAAAVTVADVLASTVTAIDTATDDFNLSVGGSILSLETSNNGYVTATTFFTDIADFTITSDNLGTGEDASLTPPRVLLPRVPTGTENGPTTSQQIEQAARSLVNVINDRDTLVYAYYISGANDVPGQINFENRSTTGPAFYITSNSTATGEEFTPTLPTSGNGVVSSNEVRPNRVYFSKYQQPEAVPLPNYIDIGPKDREIKRIIALRDSLFVLKEDGVYRLTGDAAPFQVAPFDFSVQVLAPDTAVVLNNQIYAFSTQGVIAITDTGVSVISRPIENRLLSISREAYDYKTISFGVSYESDRAYLLWLPTNTTDTVATQCFRYNTFTQSWTRWDKSSTAGIVNFADDKLYIGAGDVNYVEKERKNLNRTDHADRDFDVQILADGVDSDVIQINLSTNIEIGDRIIQTQYLTQAQYNRLLRKLDIDPTVADTDYFSTLEFVPGNNPRTKIEELTTKLDADTGISDSNYTAVTADYTQTITTNTVASQTVINFSSNSILTNRYVTISGSNCTPSINGTHQVIASNGTSITIDVPVTIAGSAGTVQTATQDFRDVQACFNIINNKLNLDAGVFFSNYGLSSGSTEFETVVFGVDRVQNTLTLKDPIQLMEGDITVFKAINTRIIWAPQYFQDPSIFKQVSEGTVMFENTNYTKATVAYGTDLSPSFETITVDGQGDGDWGQFDWGNMNWGGLGAAYPIRTYIPRQKQRCRFMNVRFEHSVALEKFSLYGITLKFRAYSSKAYK